MGKLPWSRIGLPWTGRETYHSRYSMDEKVNILMVDDQPSRLLSYEVILAELGENLIRANCGKEALELLLKMMSQWFSLMSTCRISTALNWPT